MRNESRSVRQTHRRVRQARVVLGALTLCACTASGIVDVPADGRSQTIAAAIGQEVDVTLGNVGPAIYVSPPMISSGAVTYLGVEIVPPYTPGGPTQRFRFKATSAGLAILTFQRTLGESLISVVEDTVRVR
jgi:hypothetical protein